MLRKTGVIDLMKGLDYWQKYCTGSFIIFLVVEKCQFSSCLDTKFNIYSYKLK